VIPTTEEDLPDPNPPFDLFSDGRINYPYTLRYNLQDRRVPRIWRTLNLENEYLLCTVLPDLGGHLYRCLDKINGAEMFYANPSIKFARIAYRGAWAALGVEFNFPVSHNWMTVSPVDFGTTTDPDGSASVWVGNIDRVYGMQWRVQLTLRPGRAVLEQHTWLYNRDDTRHRFYWWTNAGVQVWDDSRIIYPMQFTAAHGFADIDTWPVNRAGVDLSVVGNHKFGPVSRFSYGSREPYMAVYHPRTHAGVVHYSSPINLPAKKIWSWGVDEDALDWRKALSDNESAYVEIQAGLFRDQETYGFLEPQEVAEFSEFWIPIRDLGDVTRANPDAVISLSRSPAGAGAVSLDLAANVTRELPGATLALTNGTSVIASETAVMSPRTVFRKRFANLPEQGVYTVTIRDSSGSPLLQHTEGGYDYLPASEVHTGPQPSHQYPPPDSRTSDDFLAISNEQERQGQLLDAMATYKMGLANFPSSLELHRAAGRLAVGLKQYSFAIMHLSQVLARTSNDHESLYYAGLAWEAEGHSSQARQSWELAQQFGAYRGPALMSLAALAAREGDRSEALRLTRRAISSQSGMIRAGEQEVTLLRSLDRRKEAKQQLEFWRRQDPTNSLLRYEATHLGGNDPALWSHLAGDTGRILELAGEYMRLGLYADACDLLARNYPSGPDVVAEPGAPRPEADPLIAYYRGFCRYQMKQDGSADFAAAELLPTSYVFPSRADSFLVLRRAVEVNPKDANAHFLLGSLYMSGGMTSEAMEEWEKALELNHSIPTLHRNLGYAVLRTGGSTEKAIQIFEQGIQADPKNVGVYLGLEEALEKAGRPPLERARALERFPDHAAVPAALTFRLVRLLGEAGLYDEAERQLAGRFYAREEGGADVREIYVELRLRQASALADKKQCGQALTILDHLGDALPNLPFTRAGLRAALDKAETKDAVAAVRSACAKP
jgi:tetratricopeptide (TPR) repeat protein